jgi:uridine phosphorylase
VPTHLRPTAPIAADAVLVGDPGRALLLAQELLTEPKMSNHAHGLWGYSGQTQAGNPLTIQATGIGGPSAALVLADLVELGVRRAVRVGTCAALEANIELGELVLVTEAIAAGGSATALGASGGGSVEPDRGLTAALGDELGDDSRAARIVSFDAHPAEQPPQPGASAADMQTAPLLAQAQRLGIEVAAALIAAERIGGDEVLEREPLERVERLAGRAASRALST